MNLTNAWRAKVYDALLRGVTLTAPATVYLRLFSANPGIGTPSFADEASGGSYTGQPVDMDAPTAGAGSNTSTITFANMPAGTWTHWAIAATAAGADPDDVILVGELTSARTTSEGASLPLAAGDFDLTVA